MVSAYSVAQTRRADIESILPYFKIKMQVALSLRLLNRARPGDKGSAGSTKPPIYKFYRMGYDGVTAQAGRALPPALPIGMRVPRRRTPCTLWLSQYLYPTTLFWRAANAARPFFAPFGRLIQIGRRGTNPCACAGLSLLFRQSRRANPPHRLIRGCASAWTSFQKTA
jgi:hypothetical protein